MTRRGLLAIAVLGALLAASAAVSAPSVLPRATQANRSARAVFRKAPRG